MEDFLSTLAMEPNRNTSAYESYHRIYVPHGIPLKSNAHEPLVLIFSFNIYKRCFQELVEAIETAAVEKKDCSQGRYRQRTA
ncbi:hypothetical protein WN943_026729 [Citrus x changshan-huyou]